MAHGDRCSCAAPQPLSNSCKTARKTAIAAWNVGDNPLRASDWFSTKRSRLRPWTFSLQTLKFARGQLFLEGSRARSLRKRCGQEALWHHKPKSSSNTSRETNSYSHCWVFPSCGLGRGKGLGGLGALMPRASGPRDSNCICTFAEIKHRSAFSHRKVRFRNAADGLAGIMVFGRLLRSVQLSLNQHSAGFTQKTCTDKIRNLQDFKTISKKKLKRSQLPQNDLS